MMLGKAYLRLKNKEKAKEWLKKTVEYCGARIDEARVRISDHDTTLHVNRFYKGRTT